MPDDRFQATSETLIGQTTRKHKFYRGSSTDYADQQLPDSQTLDKQFSAKTRELSIASAFKKSGQEF